MAEALAINSTLTALYLDVRFTFWQNPSNTLALTITDPPSNWSTYKTRRENGRSTEN